MGRLVGGSASTNGAIPKVMGEGPIANRRKFFGLMGAVIGGGPDLARNMLKGAAGIPYVPHNLPINVDKPWPGAEAVEQFASKVSQEEIDMFENNSFSHISGYLKIMRGDIPDHVIESVDRANIDARFEKRAHEIDNMRSVAPSYKYIMAMKLRGEVIKESWKNNAHRELRDIIMNNTTSNVLDRGIKELGLADLFPKEVEMAKKMYERSKPQRDDQIARMNLGNQASKGW